MKKGLAITLVAVCVVCGAGSWLFGQQAQLIQQDILDTAKSQGRLDSVQQSFERGVFSTDAKGQLTAAGGDIALSWQQTTDHGPVPWQRLVSGDAKLVPTQAAVALNVMFVVQTVLGTLRSEQPLRLDTTIGLMGDLAGTIQFDGLDQQLDAFGQLALAPASGQYEYSNADRRLNFTLAGDGVELQGPMWELQQAQPKITCDVTVDRRSSQLPLGSCELTTPSLSFSNAHVVPTRIRDGRATIASLRAGEWLNIHQTLTLDQLALGDPGVTLANVTVEARIDGLSEIALRDFQQRLADGPPLIEPADWRPVLAQLFNSGEPVMALTAAANRDAQSLNLTAGVEISPGLLGNGSSFALMSAIQTWINLEIHQGLFHDLVDLALSRPTQAGIQPLDDSTDALIARWVELGVLVADEDRWRLDMAYHLGVISLNDKTINPVDFMRQ